MPEEILEPKRKKGRFQRFTEAVLNPVEVRVTRELNEEYLQEGEDIVDYLPETIIPAIDFRWVVLTNQRMIFITRFLMETEFKDMSFDSMEFEYKRGTVLFDEISFERFSATYKAQFYSFYRDHILRFVDEIEEAVRGTSIERTSQEAIHTLKDLAELREKGIISQEEYEEKKKKYLDEI